MDRFWAKVRKSDACWEWTGARLRLANGSLSYGVVRFDGRLQMAHRVSWQLIHGPIPMGAWVLHHCDNRGCVRPDHLKLGDHAENMRDAVERHRMTTGENRPAHKLRESDLPAIRAMIASGLSPAYIGSIFGVSARTIRYIRSGERWKS